MNLWLCLVEQFLNKRYYYSHATALVPMAVNVINPAQTFLFTKNSKNKLNIYNKFLPLKFIHSI